MRTRCLPRAIGVVRVKREYLHHGTASVDGHALLLEQAVDLAGRQARGVTGEQRKLAPSQVLQVLALRPRSKPRAAAAAQAPRVGARPAGEARHVGGRGGALRRRPQAARVAPAARAARHGRRRRTTALVLEQAARRDRRHAAAGTAVRWRRWLSSRGAAAAVVVGVALLRRPGVLHDPRAGWRGVTRPSTAGRGFAAGGGGHGAQR